MLDLMGCCWAWGVKGAEPGKVDMVTITQKGFTCIAQLFY